MAKVLIWLALVTPVCSWLAAAGIAEERYTIQPGDTLWALAERYVQDGTITTYQMMVALFGANPEAFMNDNINLLKTGYALRIPTREELGVPPAPPATEDERDMAVSTARPVPVVTEQPVPVAKDADAAPALVVEDVTKLQNALALTQEQAALQHVENEALRARIAALEARVIKLDELASAQDATGRDDTAVTPSHPPSRISAWYTVSSMKVIISGAIVLGLAVIWLWGRRTTAHTAAAEATTRGTPQTRAESPATEATNPLALGLDDLDVGVEQSVSAQDITAANPDTHLETDTPAEATRAELMIDLDDLELEPAQAREEAPDLPSTVSISPKADPASPSNAC